MQVRTATAADAPKIASIHIETWRAAYRGQVPDTVLNALNIESRTVFFHERLTQLRGQLFVAEDGGSLVGYCDLIPSRDKDADPEVVAEIGAIYILPAHWRKGAGRALCDSALAEARRRGYKGVTLWVLASNVAARHFYQAMGFSLDGAKKADTMKGGHELHEVRFRMAV
jgi:ribosomal protein S18 acetylase RimI-like enzyme